MGRVVLAMLALVVSTEQRALAQQEDWRAEWERGEALRREGKPRESLARYRSAIEILDGSELRKKYLVSALVSLAKRYGELGERTEADRSFRRALAEAEKLMGTTSVGRAQVLVEYADTYLRRGAFPAAEGMIREAIGNYSRWLSPDNRLLAVARSCLAQTLWQKGELPEALGLIDRALDVLGKGGAGLGENLAMSLNTKGLIVLDLGRRAEAAELFERSANFLEEAGADRSRLLYPLDNLAVLRYREGRMEVAAARFEQALGAAKNSVGEEDTVYAGVLMNYSECLRAEGRKGEAKKAIARAREILKRNGLDKGAGLTVDIASLRAK